MINKEKHIALLVDVDNVEVSLDNLNEIINILKNTGCLDFIKLYGYNERKHTNWGDTISYNGILTCNTMRFRKRNKSQLDIRLIIDALKLNYTQPNINAFCIIAGKGDLVPVLAELRLNGKHLYDVMNYCSEINGHMFNERILIDSEIDPVKKKRKILSKQLQAFSERTAAMAMEDNVDMKEKNNLIAEVENVLKEMAEGGEGKASNDEEEKELFTNLQNILEILKTF